ncbi:MAG: hypothetical protein ACM3ME_03825, partial [Chloroflexota bacterium]
MDSIVIDNMSIKDGTIKRIEVFKFTSGFDKSNLLIVSKVDISNRDDFPSKSFLYKVSGLYNIVIFDDCYVNSELFEELIPLESKSYYAIIDSLDLPQTAFSGLVSNRLFLYVVKIKREKFQR